jgi:hypothetical protein
MTDVLGECQPQRGFARVSLVPGTLWVMGQAQHDRVDVQKPLSSISDNA